MNIRISQLEFAYPNRAFHIRIPELAIKSGDRVAFVGPSGSGKTTLLRLIAGIHLPQAGRMALDSLDPLSLGDAARREFRITRIGFVFQDFQLIEYLDVEQNIRLPFRIHPALTWSGETARRMDRLTADTGIADKRGRAIHQLSQGEKQRVALCRALITQPKLVLADEPTGNLDSANKKRILGILFEETRKCGATLVMVTHDRELLDGFDEVVDFQDFTSAAFDAYPNASTETPEVGFAG